MLSALSAAGAHRSRLNLPRQRPVRVHKLGLPVVVLGAVVALNLPAAALAGGTGPHAVGQANTVPGAVWAWGDGNGNGGGGSIAPLSARGLSDVVALAVVCPSPGAGEPNTGYALRKDGTVWAWGTGSDGELGNGTASTSSAPVQVHHLSGVVAVAGGGDTAYALRKDGTVWAWGTSLAGELGDGSNGPAQGYSDVPVRVQGLSGAVAVAGGGSDGYAVLNNGTVWAWGADQDGQLGNGAQGSGSDVPVRVHGLSDVVAVAADSWDDSVLALRKDGTIWHWGADANEASSASNDVPAVVHGLSHVVAITGGYFTEFALLSDGTVRGWGDDEDGEMGNGLDSYAALPVQVSGLHGAVAIAGGVAEEFAVVVPKR